MSATNDSFVKTLTVAVVLCLFCSLVVSGAAVMLKKEQQANKAADVQRSILIAAKIVKPDEQADFTKLFNENIEARVIELATGEVAKDFDPAKFDQRQAAKDPELSVKLNKKEDPASIKRQAKYAKVYLVKKGDNIEAIVLPVHGYGLFSTLYGFIALEGDTRTVAGLRFYEHGETPGLGAEVENPQWIAKWPGKVVLNDQYQPTLEMVKTGATENNEVDALSGASYTSTGVENLVNYWLGEKGFGPFLAKVRGGQHGV
ncbi:Na(+)-translocating NADH-quinone reductase subunit C [Pleionea litopenaei]|uniref:Na(+)-translocating NADH-quinone reductase subunit C n=1 Tax=Pleionea litopenaei TaxID=3070815 RepID=A0AA51X664_9GAMM|nr:Na(+)-translocating NADH-quinone reductase subunit C [Pleionea sp. HL-JVS1]WMS86501.1 Na(+)-translocating NADH-quinone reductase subunit C [Pleionea sp. HL-JVS1]